MGDDRPLTFGELLLRFRRAAGLSQAELSTASGVSVRALRDLERGRAQAAQQRSAEVLADALGLTGSERALFLTAAKDGRRRTARTDGEDALCRLPPAVPVLVGRERELLRLQAEAQTGGVVAIVGHPGVGKTALALYAAHQHAARFPDGCFAVDLRGVDEQPVGPRAALEALLRALGVPAARIPAAEDEQSNLLRTVVAGRRVLVLLDNAADEAQVRPLLVTAPGCLTLITCRRALAGLESARWLWLDVLSDPAAVDLLAMTAGADRVSADPGAAAALASLCGNLPLAVRIAADRLATRPDWSLAYLVALLRDERTRLGSLSLGDLQVRSAFEMSYRRLSPAARRVLRRLAAVPGADFGVELASVATGTPAFEAHQYLDELVDASLLQVAVTAGRFQFHDLIRIFAGERRDAEEAPEQREAHTHAVLGYLVGAATAPARAFLPDTPADLAARAEAGGWLAREGSNWVAAQRAAARLGWHREVVDLAKAMHWYSDNRIHEQPWDQVFGLGVASARSLGDRHDEAVLLNFLGWAQYMCLGDDEAGFATHTEALAVAVGTGDRREQAWAHCYLGMELRRFGRLAPALEHTRQACVLAEEFGFFEMRMSMRNALGVVLRDLGRHVEALTVHHALLADAEKHRADTYPEMWRWMVALVLGELGDTYSALGRWHRAAEAHGEARTLHATAGVHDREARHALREARAWREAGEYGRARECLRRVLELCAGPVDHTQREEALAELARLPGGD